MTVNKLRPGLYIELVTPEGFRITFRGDKEDRVWVIETLHGDRNHIDAVKCGDYAADCLASDLQSLRAVIDMAQNLELLPEEMPF